MDSLVKTQGHVKAVRSFKNLHFVDLSDGSTHSTLNVVLNGDTNINFKVGQSVSFVGKWVESKGSQDYELLYDSTENEHKAAVIGEVPELYPIQKKVTVVSVSSNTSYIETSNIIIGISSSTSILLGRSVPAVFRAKRRYKGPGTANYKL